MRTDLANTDQYIAEFPADIQTLLQQMRETIRAAAPDATEAIKYAMPTFVLHGNLVHFAAFKNHIGFYPGASGVARFMEDLKAYHTSKGAIQFPIGEPLPLGLVATIVQFRVQENTEKAELKKSAKKSRPA